MFFETEIYRGVNNNPRIPVKMFAAEPDKMFLDMKKESGDTAGVEGQHS